MHAHAEQLDELMFALADDDLEAAATPAFWLSRHDTVDGIPEEWQEYVTGMREAAAEVEAASDLEAAKAAAEDISDQCQACHNAAGINALNGG
jgi:cytochrome c556